MDHVPASLAQTLREFGQEHVLAWWDELSGESRVSLVAQLESLNFDELKSLYERRDEKINLPPSDAIAPLPRSDDEGLKKLRHYRSVWSNRDVAEELNLQLDRDRRDGEDVLRYRSLAFLIVAGGQGSRLGFDHPKGMFPIGPISNKTLFQIHAEKILALSRKYTRAPDEFENDKSGKMAEWYAKTIPLFIMTSAATHAETAAYFFEHDYFGLSPDRVEFFEQGAMPALDFDSGRLLMESKDRLFLGPNGHGGTITGLAEKGILAWMKKWG